MRKIVLTILCSFIFGSLFAQVTVVATGFLGPIGITRDNNGNLYVAQPGTGNNDGRIDRIILPGNNVETVITGLPSFLDTATGEIVGAWRAYPDSGGVLRVIVGGKTVPGAGTIMTFDMSSISPGDSLDMSDTVAVLHVKDWVMTNGFGDSNIYSAVWHSNGNIYISDAGANAVLTADSAGNFAVLDTFPPIPNTFTPFPPFIDYVPTKIIQKDADEFFLANLTGFPFVPNIASVVTIDTTGAVTPYASGLTQVVDIECDTMTGNLYILTFGLYDTTFTPMPNSAMIIRIQPGGATDTLASGFGPSAGFVRDSTNGFFVTELFTGSVLHVGLTTGINTNPSQVAFFTAYPNPSSEEINFSFSLLKTADVRYELYDVNGRMIFSEDAGTLTAGAHSFRMDNRKLGSGLYHFVLNTGENRQAVKFLVN